MRPGERLGLALVHILGDPELNLGSLRVYVDPVEELLGDTRGIVPAVGAVIPWAVAPAVGLASCRWDLASL